MLKTIEEEFPEGVKWTHPEGGLFMWVTVPESINTTEMMKKCVENNVAYVPGVAFYPDGMQQNKKGKGRRTEKFSGKIFD